MMMHFNFIFFSSITFLTGEVASYWTQISDDDYGESAGDAFGTPVAISLDGSRIAVGARLNKGKNGNKSGPVRVYEYINKV